jgi:hypothetical protein
VSGLGIASSVSWILDGNGLGGDQPVFPDGYNLYRSGKRPPFDNNPIPGPDHWHLRPLPERLPEYDRLPGSAHPTLQ